jgi:hypothetical protein
VLQNPRQAGLQKHARDGGVMHPQLLGDGADRPLLYAGAVGRRC